MGEDRTRNTAEQKKEILSIAERVGIDKIQLFNFLEYVKTRISNKNTDIIDVVLEISNINNPAREKTFKYFTIIGIIQFLLHMEGESLKDIIGVTAWQKIFP